MDTPRHEHKCQSCTFLGRHKEYDLYFCNLGPTVVAITKFNSESGITAALKFHRGNILTTALLMALKHQRFRSALLKEFLEKEFGTFSDTAMRLKEVLLVDETLQKDYPLLLNKVSNELLSHVLTLKED